MDFNSILDLENYVNEHPNSPLAIRLASSYLESRVKVGEAISFCRKIISYHPEYQNAYILLAKCYLIEKKFQEANSVLYAAKARFLEFTVIEKLNDLIYEIIAESGFKADSLNNIEMSFSHISDDEYENVTPGTVIQREQAGTFSHVSENFGLSNETTSYIPQNIEDSPENIPIDLLVEKHKRNFIPVIDENVLNSVLTTSDNTFSDFHDIDSIIEEKKESILPKVVESPTIKEVITNDIYLVKQKDENSPFDEDYFTKDDFEQMKLNKNEGLNLDTSFLKDMPEIKTESFSKSINKDLIIGDLLTEFHKATKVPENITTSDEEIFFNPEEYAIPSPDPGIFKDEKDENITENRELKNLTEKFDLFDEIAQLNSGETHLLGRFPPGEVEKSLSDEEISSKIKQGELPEKFVNKTLANIYESQNRYEEAIEVYNQLFLNEKITESEYDFKLIELREKLMSKGSFENDLLI